jgi:hypothetical protein
MACSARTRRGSSGLRAALSSTRGRLAGSLTSFTACMARARTACSWPGAASSSTRASAGASSVGRPSRCPRGSPGPADAPLRASAYRSSWPKSASKTRGFGGSSVVMACRAHIRTVTSASVTAEASRARAGRAPSPIRLRLRLAATRTSLASSPRRSARAGAASARPCTCPSSAAACARTGARFVGQQPHRRLAQPLEGHPRAGQVLQSVEGRQLHPGLGVVEGLGQRPHRLGRVLAQLRQLLRRRHPRRPALRCAPRS